MLPRASHSTFSFRSKVPRFETLAPAFESTFASQAVTCYRQVQGQQVSPTSKATVLMLCAFRTSCVRQSSCLPIGRMGFYDSITFSFGWAPRGLNFLSSELTYAHVLAIFYSGRRAKCLPSLLSALIHALCGIRAPSYEQGQESNPLPQS
jgi:hypothetical protein